MSEKLNNENPVIVMKFGGTSLRNEKYRLLAVRHIKYHYKIGKKIVVVVSAMGRKGEPYATDTLISLMKKIGEPVNPSELDNVISIGETLSALLFSHLLNQNKLPAKSFTGGRAGIITNNNPGNAEIIKIDTALLNNTINQDIIAVVAGFQGITSEGDIRTLGRGGSDTSAVALGSAVNAEFVEIYTDVDGIANCDPRKVPAASYLKKIGIKQVLSMTDEGSKVLHPRSVKACTKSKIPIVVRNTFSNAKGTLICHSLPKNKIEQIVLAHREGLRLIEIKSKKDLKQITSEMILIDNKRCLLKDDVYIDRHINELENCFGTVQQKPGYATISVVFEKQNGKKMIIPEAEIIFIGKNVTRYLLKEAKLAISLKKLFDYYKLGNNEFLS